jgi:hypothetical protein
MAPAEGFLMAPPTSVATTTGFFVNLPYRPRQGKRIFIGSLPRESARTTLTNHTSVEKGSTNTLPTTQIPKNLYEELRAASKVTL